MIKRVKHSDKEIYKCLIDAVQQKKKLFAILFDPEELKLKLINDQLKKLPQYTTHIFIGGSTANESQTQIAVRAIKSQTNLPIILFPGDYRHITAEADGILFLSLLSGENPEYLIRQQIHSVEKLKHTDLEIIPTGYILIDGGKETAVQRVSKTQPLSQDKVELIVNTALAGEYSGKKLIYLEAGSGAVTPVSIAIIKAVKSQLGIPLIVGGGIRNKDQLKEAYNAGADLVVIGTAFENGTF